MKQVSKKYIKKEIFTIAKQYGFENNIKVSFFRRSINITALSLSVKPSVFAKFIKEVDVKFGYCNRNEDGMNGDIPWFSTDLDDWDDILSDFDLSAPSILQFMHDVESKIKEVVLDNDWFKISDCKYEFDSDNRCFSGVWFTPQELARHCVYYDSLRTILDDNTILDFSNKRLYICTQESN